MENVVYMVFIDFQGSHCFFFCIFLRPTFRARQTLICFFNASETTLVAFFQDLVLHRFGGAGTRLVGEPEKNPGPDRR